MTAQVLPPPSTSIGPRAWLRANLFSTWFNSLLTVVVGGLLLLVLVQVTGWALTEARWGVVTSNLRLFLIGQYPGDQAWRVVAALTVISVLAGFSAGIYGPATRTLGAALAAGQVLIAVLALASEIGWLASVALLINATLVGVAFYVSVRWRIPRRLLMALWLASLPISFLLLGGLGTAEVPKVATSLWGGLLLTFLLAIVGIVLSFPFGVLLALGRRSALPAVRVLSTVYIEVIRGVPLITILFMADIMLPLFLPGEVRIDRVLRAMGGITLFSAAYVAENVRGGLQAVPSGQGEAASALGLSGVQTNIFIVLPQALRSVIPANVGLFISLLKDTTLVTIIGLLELLGIGRAVLAQTEWFGAQLEVYVFVAAVFFVLCYAMSQASYRLETAMGVGSR
ncbi:MAG: amino acid ABC transporter permease [Candidatus Limnocylindria bacterium]